MRSTLFKKPDESKTDFDYYINQISINLNSLRRVKKTIEELPYHPDDIIHVVGEISISKNKVNAGIKAQEDRIAALRKMKNNEAITAEEHELLKKIPVLNDVVAIRNYENITKLPSPSG